VANEKMMPQLVAPEEEWRPIPEFPTYEASSRGRVRRLANGRTGRSTFVLRQTPNQTGYQCVQLYREGKSRYMQVSNAVLLAFVGPMPQAGMHGAHHNDNRLDNSIENLWWATPAQNAAEAIANGRRPRGENIPTALTDERDVLPMRYAAALGLSYKRIGDMFGATKKSVEHLAHGDTWGHAPLPSAEFAALSPADRMRLVGKLLVAHYGEKG
jgi:hypothetical protein